MQTVLPGGVAIFMILFQSLWFFLNDFVDLQNVG